MYDDELGALAACLDDDAERARELLAGLTNYALAELAREARTLAELASEASVARLGGQDQSLRLTGGA